MSMKKYFNYLLMAALVGGLSWSVTACSDDDDKNDIKTITVDDDLIEHGIQVEAAGETVDVNVKMEGTWTANIDNAELNGETWATIKNNHLTFQGMRTLRLSFTPNPDGSDRRATLNLFGLDGDPVTIAISQKGKDANDAASSSAVEFMQHGLGHGVNVSYAMDTAYIAKRVDPDKGGSFQWQNIMRTDMVYNMRNIEKLVNTGALNAEAYTEAKYNVFALKASLIDSTVAQDKNFGVGINMSLSFGFIEFSAGVTYQAQKSERRGHVDWSIIRKAPKYHTAVSPLEIATYAKDQSADGLMKYGEEYAKLEEDVATKYGSWEELKKKNVFIYNAWQKKLNTYRPDFGNVFSTGFSGVLWDYYKGMMTGDTQGADKALANIDESFSPFFITGGDWGGSMSILVRIDTTKMQGKDTLWAELTGSLGNFGDVSGNLSLSTDGMNLLRNCQIDVNLLGGDPKVGDEVTSWILSPDVTSYSRLQGVLSDWVDSMTSPSEGGNKQSSALPTEFIYTPIWQLMDPDYRDYARDWFMAKYKDNPSVMSYFAIAEGTHASKDGAGALMAGSLEKTNK